MSTEDIGKPGFGFASPIPAPEPNSPEIPDSSNREAAQDRHPPSGDVTSPSLDEAVERLSDTVATYDSFDNRDIPVDLADPRTLLAAYVEMKEGLAVSQESGSRPHFANAYELVNHIGRMSHTGDEGYCWGDNDEDVAGRDTLDGLVDMARDIMSMSSTRALSSQTPAPVEESRETIKDLRSKLDLALLVFEYIKGYTDETVTADRCRGAILEIEK